MGQRPTSLSAGTPAPPEQPRPDCALCPRLVDFRAGNTRAQPNWHNAPVPSFGGLDARLLIVGLAPGLRGANASGRPFTGDYAGALLFPTLLTFGFAAGTYGARADDGLRLKATRISNAVRCVPPQNKPTTTEIKACAPFLAAEIAAMPRLAVIVTLGSIAHGSVLKALGVRAKDAPFGHGAEYAAGGTAVIASYHCSRLNTNTGRLTTAMFESIFARARAITG
ncbi:MAG: uracil-DNA glycosylase [Alphaproteobacteria bacterium]